MPRRIRRRGLVLLGALALTAAVPPAAQAVPVVGSVDLCAKEGEITLPGTPDPVPIWGFVVKPALLLCSDPSVVPSLPGPTLEVPAGAPVTVNLQNELSENVSLVFPGQDLIPDPVGAAPGSSVSYTFTPSPGTYLYEAGTNNPNPPGGNAMVQVPMGLYGALIARPATPNQAYGASTAYDKEAVLVLSEIDPLLNGTANPNDFNLLDYHPTYWLINGQAYDPSAPPPPIWVAPNDDVLLRYLNPGLQHHTMMLLGLHQRVHARDAYLLMFPFDAVSETIPSGSTADMITTVPAGATPGTRFPLYSRSLYVTNGPAYPGGMLTFLEVAEPPLNTAAPTISGTAQDGQTLTAADGTWTGTPPLSFSYQWRLCDAVGDNCSDISGATGQTYVVGPTDVGSTLRVVVSASNAGGGPIAATSDPTAVVIP